MKAHTVIITITEKNKSIQDLLEFLQEHYSNVTVSILNSNNNHYTLELITKDNFHLAQFEDFLDCNMYPVEFLYTENLD